MDRYKVTTIRRIVCIEDLEVMADNEDAAIKDALHKITYQSEHGDAGGTVVEYEECKGEVSCLKTIKVE